MIYHVILLAIISNDILLSSLIIYIYYFIPNSLSIQYIRSFLSIIRKWFSFIVLLRSIPVCHFTAVLISTHQYFIYWDSTFFYLDYFTEFCN